MTSIINYLKQHRIFKLSIYHVISLVLVYLAMLSPGFKSGPCTPGLDLLLYCPVFLIDSVLVLAGLVLCILKGRAVFAALFINLLALGVLLAAGAMRA